MWFIRGYYIHVILLVLFDSTLTRDRRRRDRDSRERRSESRGDRRRDRERDRDRRRERSRERSRSRERDWGPPDNGWERSGSPLDRGEWVGGGWDSRHDVPRDYPPPPQMRPPHMPEYDRDGYEYPPRVSFEHQLVIY